MKILLIGQAPGRGGSPSKPLLGSRTGRRLAFLFGMSEAEYERRFDRMNALDFWPGKNGKGDSFPAREAKITAARKIGNIHRDKILFVGIATARVFNFKYPILKWRKFNGGIAATLPHPSGVNHWYNDRKNVKKAARFLRAMLDYSGYL